MPRQLAGVIGARLPLIYFHTVQSEGSTPVHPVMSNQRSGEGTMLPPPRRILHLCRVLSIAATCAILATAALAGGANYWIDESTDFTGNGCENADLNDVTSS